MAWQTCDKPSALPCASGPRPVRALPAPMRALALVCALVLALAAAFAFPPTAHADGDAAAYDGGPIDVSWYVLHQDDAIFTIRTPEQLAGLARLCNIVNEPDAVHYDAQGAVCEGADGAAGAVRKAVTFEGKTVRLAADVDLSAYTWENPIGNNANSRWFSGTFDGQGHAVRLGGQRGLFGVVRFGTVRSLVVEGSVECAKYTGYDVGGLGAVAGRVVGGSVLDCTNRATVANAYVPAYGSTNNDVGGIAGYVASHGETSAVVLGCVNEGAVSSTGAVVAGIAGQLSAEGSADAPGIVLVQNCWNKADVGCSSTLTDDQSAVAGIAGTTSYRAVVRIAGCVNSGAVSASRAQSSAGILGNAGLNGAAAATVTLEGCANVGAVSSSRARAAGLLGVESGTAPSGEGAVPAYSYSVRNCYNAGAVTSTRPGGALGGRVIAGAVGSADAGWFNNYYLEGSAAKAFGSGADLGDAAAVPLAAGDLADAAARLGDAFAADGSGQALNGGFPLLRWQDPDAAFDVVVRVALVDDFNDAGDVPVVKLADASGRIVASAEAAWDGQRYEAAFAAVPKGAYTCTASKDYYDDATLVVIVNTTSTSSDLEVASTRYAFDLAVSPDAAEVVLVDAAGNSVAPVSTAIDQLDEGHVAFSFALPNGDYSYTVEAFGYVGAEGSVSVYRAPAAADVQLAVAAGTTRTFRFSAPAGAAFGDHDPIMYVFHNGKACLKSQADIVPGSGGTAAVLEAELPMGTYSYYAKAAGCEPLTGTLAVSSDGATELAFAPQEPWDGKTADTYWRDLHAGEEDLYLRTPADLAGLSVLVRGGDSLEGVRVHLLGSIDMGHEPLATIGYVKNLAQRVRVPFSGEFDGGGFAISNFLAGYVDGQSTSAGLFGSLVGASVHDVVLTDAKVTGFGSEYAGGLVGQAVNSTIRACSVDAEVACDANGGGVVCGQLRSEGEDTASISDCVASGALGVTASNCSGFGGIVGSVSGSASISGCTNRAALTYALADTSYATLAEMGGIVGSTSTDRVTIDSCVNEGSITSARAGVGGIAGSVAGSALASGTGTSIVGCVNRGSVTCAGMSSGAGGTGGVVGLVVSSRSRTLVERCANEGAVSCLAPASDASAAGVVGLAKEAGTYLSVIDCYSTGAVSATGSAGARASGIIGSVYADVTVRNCYAAGRLSTASASRQAGVSANCSSSAGVSNCYYLEGSAARGLSSGADEAGVVQARAAWVMRSLAFLAELDADGVYMLGGDANDGFPVFGEQPGETLLMTSFAAIPAQTYTGSPLHPEVSVRNAEGDVLAEGADYSVSFADPSGAEVGADQMVDAGAYVVSVTGKGLYSGTVARTFTVNPMALSEDMFQVNSIPFTGTPTDPAAAVSSTLANGVDYTVETYAATDQASLGMHQVQVHGKGNYRGSLVFAYEITSGTVALSGISPLTYNGRAQAPTLSVVNSAGDVLQLGRDYTVSYERDGVVLAADQVVDAGRYQVVVAGAGNYEGSSATGEFLMDRALFNVLFVSDAAYTGSAVQLDVQAVLVGSSLRLGPGDYELSFRDASGAAVAAEDLREPGDYTVAIQGAGNYRGLWELPFSIVAADFEVDAIPAASFSGKPLAPQVTVWARGADREHDEPLREGDGYTLAFGKVDPATRTVTWDVPADELKAAGTYVVAVTGAGGRVGTLRLSYLIDPAGLAFVAEVSAPSFTGAPLPVAYSVVGLLGDERPVLADGAQFTVEYAFGGQPVGADGVLNAGTYTITATGRGDYAGSVAVAEFAVAPGELAVEAGGPVVYDARPQAPTPQVSVGGNALDSGYYAVTYERVTASGTEPCAASDVVAAGDYNVCVTPHEAVAANFATGGVTLRAPFSVQQADLKAAAANVIYTGAAVFPDLSVTSGQRPLSPAEYAVSVASADGRTVAVEELVSAGSYVLTVRPHASGSFTQPAVQVPFDVEPAQVQVMGLQSRYYASDHAERGEGVQLTVVSGGRELDSSQYAVHYLDQSLNEIDESAIWADSGGTYVVAVVMNDRDNYAPPTFAQSFEVVGIADASGDADGEPAGQVPESHLAPAGAPVPPTIGSGTATAAGTGQFAQAAEVPDTDLPDADELARALADAADGAPGDDPRDGEAVADALARAQADGRADGAGALLSAFAGLPASVRYATLFGLLAIAAALSVWRLFARRSRQEAAYRTLRDSLSR